MKTPMLRTTALLAALLLAACDKASDKASDRASDQASAPVAGATVAETPTDEVKISKEYWDTTGKLKFFYELRRDANGKWKRNGVGRAYYSSGELEREGIYRDNTRIGVWTYYKPDGEVLRVEDRGQGNPSDD